MYIRLKLLVEELSKAAKDYKGIVRSHQKKGLEQGTDEFDNSYFRVLTAQRKVKSSRERNNIRANNTKYHTQWLQRLIRNKKT